MSIREGRLIDTDESRFSENADRRLARGQIERIGGEAVYSFRGPDGEGTKGTEPLRDHRAGIALRTRPYVSRVRNVHQRRRHMPTMLGLDIGTSGAKALG